MTVTVRDAATVMLIRDARDEADRPAIEVCMLRRNLASEFVAGAYVFPGGSVDPDDRGPMAEALCRGRTDAEASALLGVESGGLAFWVAALRSASRRPGCSSPNATRTPSGATAPCSTPATGWWRGASRPIAALSTTRAPGCSTSAARRVWCWRPTRCTM